MVEYLHILEFICLFALFTTNLFFLIIILVCLWNLIARIEKAFVVFGPRSTTELYPHQFIFEVLSCLGILHIEGFPVRATLLLTVCHELAIMTPVCGAHLSFTISIHSVWIHVNLGILEGILLVQLIASLLFDPVPRGLRCQSTIVAKIIVLAVLARDTDFGKIPIVRNCLFELIPRVALRQELVS